MIIVFLKREHKKDHLKFMTNSNKFYSKILPLYEKLISYKNRKERETSFWSNLFNKYHIQNAHDCSCGTGHHIILFNDLNVSCSGSDLSDDMVRKARRNCEEKKIKCNIIQADFCDIGNYLLNTVDLIVNLGNSLAYVDNKKKILNYLKGCYIKLSNNGVLVLDLRNYDYLLQEKPRFIPISFRENYGFIYVLEYEKRSIQFNILYFNLKNRDFQTFSTTYYPILFKKLIQYLRETGFKIENQYSGFKFEDFDLKTSENLIIVAKTV